MKILQVAHSLPFLNQAGTEIYTYELSQELSKKHELYITNVKTIKENAKEIEDLYRTLTNKRAYL